MSASVKNARKLVFLEKTRFFIKIGNLLLLVYSRKKEKYVKKKLFRINAKKLFLTYSKKCPKTKIKLDKEAVFRALGVKLRY